MTLATADIFGPSFLPGRVGENRPIVYWEDFVTGFTQLRVTDPVEQNPSGMFTDVADTGQWHLSVFNGNDPLVFPSMADEVGGVITMTNGSGTGKALNAQLNGEMFSLSNARELYFETRVNVASTADFYIGVSAVDTNISSLADGMIFAIENSTTVSHHLAKNTGGTVTATAATITSGDWHTFAFKCTSGKKVFLYLDGVKIATIDDAANFPDDEELSPVFMIQNNASVAETLKIDYILCVGDR